MTKAGLNSVGLLFISVIFLASCNDASDSDPYKAFERAEYTSAFPAIMALAKANDAKAQTYIAAMYQAGLGVKRDNKKAIEWYEKAAYQNYAPAQYNLGIMLREGTGVEPNIVEAYGWLYNAQQLGHPKAEEQLDLVLMSITPNKSLLAREWVRQQVKQGHKDE